MTLWASQDKKIKPSDEQSTLKGSKQGPTNGERETKEKQRTTKLHPKLDLRNKMRNTCGKRDPGKTFRIHFGRHIRSKIGKSRPTVTRREPKVGKRSSWTSMQKLMPKKKRSMPKGHQHDAQMDAKINDVSCFFEKDENARNYLFYNRKRGSEHIKMQEKSIQNRCKIDARKSDAKNKKNDAKMHPKWEPKAD